MASGRLFLALWPDEAARAALAARQRATAWPRPAGLVPSEDLHVTLHFIGSIDDERVGDVVSAASAVGAAHVELSFDRLERWRGGLAVLVPSHVPQPLIDLHVALGRALTRHAFDVEARVWRPHVTIARRVASEPTDRLAPDVPSVPWTSRGHVLAMREGAHYRVVRRFD